jgi:hypothetical protein|nr:hypothetical protein [Kofleriaceae bacterium]
MSDSHEFKRLNFFKGFLASEKDWNDGEGYHVDKRRLHARSLHAPGVVPGHAGELRVVARARGELAVEVQPGYAVDGAGNDLVIAEPTIRTLELDQLRLPQTVYVVLRYTEELADYVAYRENVDYKGHRRVLESCKVEISITEPDLSREVELARIALDKGVARIRDARDPDHPTANEIDMRYVPQAGRAGGTLVPAQRLELGAMLSSLRRGAIDYTRRGVVAAHDVVQGCNTALMMASANLVDLGNLFEVMRLIVDAEAELALDVDAHHPHIAHKKELAEYRRQVEILRGLVGERAATADSFRNLVAYQAKLAELAAAAIAGEKAAIEVPSEIVEIRPIDIRDWDPVKSMPEPPRELELAGTTWVLVDDIEILDPDSEQKHMFAIVGSKDSYKSRHKLRYPDGTVLSAGGRAHVEGYAEFKLHNLTPGRPLVILRRMDYVYGDYELELTINGKRAGTVTCAGTDRVNRWRNWPAMIAQDLITEATAMIRQQAVTADRDINLFHIWAYQPRA